MIHLKKHISFVLFFLTYLVGTGNLLACDPIVLIDVPIIDSISVNNNGFITISWQGITNRADVTKYKIYSYNSTGTPPWVDTGYEVNFPTTTFTFPVPNIKSERYLVVAFDDCGTQGKIGGGHTSVFVTKTKYDKCKLETTIGWNEYKGWSSGVNKYDICASVNGAAYSKVSTVSAGTTTFVHSNLIPSATYTYKIEAYENGSGVTASSNRLVLKAEYPNLPIPPSMKSVSVLSDDQIEISCEVDATADILTYNIQKASGNSTDFITIDSVKADAALTTINYTDKDETLITNERTYTYRIVPIDACFNTATASNIGKSILLKVINNSDNATNTLTWSDYEYWANGVVYYEVYRSINGVFNKFPITTIPVGEKKEYIDNVAEFFKEEGQFCYYVTAVEGTVGGSSSQGKSKSNAVCVFQKPMLFVPNAFTPDGANPVFKPVMAYPDDTDYSFKIFNRWGQIVYKTSSPHEGWDGADAPLGLYYYEINYKSKAESLTKRGFVSLIR